MIELNKASKEKCINLIKGSFKFELSIAYLRIKRTIDMDEHSDVNTTTARAYVLFSFPWQQHTV